MYIICCQGLDIPANYFDFVPTSCSTPLPSHETESTDTLDGDTVIEHKAAQCSVEQADTEDLLVHEQPAVEDTVHETAVPQDTVSEQAAGENAVHDHTVKVGIKGDNNSNSYQHSP